VKSGGAAPCRSRKELAIGMESQYRADCPSGNHCFALTDPKE
jgi:hypothetical protein